MKNSYYCYKIKHAWLKHSRLKNAHFILYTTEDGKKIWAKNFFLGPTSLIAQDLKKQVELIFKKGGEEYKEAALKSGFEFDTEGNLIINKAFLDGLKAQLCVSVNKADSDASRLFVNVSGMEWYDTTYVEDAWKSEIKNLLDNKVIYKKKIDEKD